MSNEHTVLEVRMVWLFCYLYVVFLRGHHVSTDFTLRLNFMLTFLNLIQFLLIPIGYDNHNNYVNIYKFSQATIIRSFK